MSLVPIQRCLYEIVPAEQLPEGVVCHVIEREGEIIGRFAELHLSVVLRDQLNMIHASFFKEQMWLQNWDPAIDRLHPPANAPRGVAEARYVFVPKEALPRGMMCCPVEDDGEFVWQIREGEMSEQARQELNAYLKVVIDRGLFVQQKP